MFLYSRGELPYAWAVPAGIGDTIVAILAVALVVTNAATFRPWLLPAWNLLGLADITVVVVGAATISLRDPASMSALLRLPLSLLPTFLVPIITASHVLIFARQQERGWRP